VLFATFSDHERQCSLKFYDVDCKLKISKKDNQNSNNFLSFDNFIKSPLHISQAQSIEEAEISETSKNLKLMIPDSPDPPRSIESETTIAPHYAVFDSTPPKTSPYSRKKTMCWCQSCNQELGDSPLSVHLPNCPARKIHCRLCDELINAADEIAHETNTCSERSVGCELCGQTIHFKEMADHREEKCLGAEVTCDRCQTLLLRCQLVPHQQESCPRRSVICPDCKEPGFHFSGLESHLKNECPVRKVLCPNECGSSVQMQELEHHISQLCPQQHVKCVRCGIEVPREKLPAHQTEECSMRPIECSRCSRMIPKEFFSSHESEKCPLLPVVCAACSENVVQSEMDSHLLHRCSRRKVICLLCGEPVQWLDLESHNMQECQQRSMSCPECSEVMRAYLMEVHISSICPERAADCPNGCGMKVKLRSLQQHAGSEECPLALYECGCGASIALCGRREHLCNCPPFKQAWSRRLMSSIKQQGPRETMNGVRQIMQLQKVTSGVALCCLVECAGDVSTAIQKLDSASYKLEMDLAAQACEAERFMRKKSSSGLSMNSLESSRGHF